MTGNRYKIEILMSRMQKLKRLIAASLRLKTLNDNPYVIKQTQKYKKVFGNRVLIKVKYYLCTT